MCMPQIRVNFAFNVTKKLVAYVKNICDGKGKSSDLSQFECKVSKTKPEGRNIRSNSALKENFSIFANEMNDSHISTNLNETDFAELKKDLCVKIEHCLEQY